MTADTERINNYWDKLLFAIEKHRSIEPLLVEKRAFLPSKLFRFRRIEKAFVQIGTRSEFLLNNIDDRESECRGNILFYTPRNQNDPFDSSSISYSSNNNHRDEIITPEISKIASNAGFIACFSELGEQPTSCSMWSHYANDFRGCCMEYNVSEWPDYWKDALFPICYKKQLYDVANKYPDEIPINNIFLPVMTNKLDDWEYEHEWRVIFDRRLCHKLDKSIKDGIKIITKCTTPQEQLKNDLLNQSDPTRIEVSPMNKNQIELSSNLARSMYRRPTPLYDGILSPFPKPTNLYFGINIDEEDRSRLIKCTELNQIKTFDMICNHTGIHFHSSI